MPMLQARFSVKFTFATLDPNVRIPVWKYPFSFVRIACTSPKCFTRNERRLQRSLASLWINGLGGWLFWVFLNSWALYKTLLYKRRLKMVKRRMYHKSSIHAMTVRLHSAYKSVRDILTLSKSLYLTEVFQLSSKTWPPIPNIGISSLTSLIRPCLSQSLLLPPWNDHAGYIIPRALLVILHFPSVQRRKVFYTVRCVFYVGPSGQFSWDAVVGFLVLRTGLLVSVSRYLCWLALLYLLVKGLKFVATLALLEKRNRRCLSFLVNGMAFGMIDITWSEVWYQISLE